MRVAAIQLNSTDDKARNLEAADRLARAAIDGGAELVVLPERWNVIGPPETLLAEAEPLDGPALQWARGLARERGITMVAGSITERVPDRERLANTSVLIGPDGTDEAVYRKIHMFDVEVGGVTYAESAIQDAGEEIVLGAVGEVPLGLTICYDLRFPELYRILAVRGARIVTVPAAFTLRTGMAHWELLLRARAVENQAFVVASDQVGEHWADHESYGHSMIVDPWGTVLASAPDGETWIAADLDFVAQDEIRERLPALANRKPETYRWPEQAPAGAST